MTRIGIAGSGFMAATHLGGYADIPDVEVVAVASPNTADEFVAEQGLDAEAYDSVEALLDGAAVDALDVCTPTPTHRPFVEAAAAAGVDVFCEKPVAPTLADARAIRDAVESAGVTCMVGHVLRFFEPYATVRDRVREGGVGEPGVARARRLSPFPEWGHGDWYAEGSGGVLVDLAIHDLDYLQWTLGPVERVFARQTGEREQVGHVTLRFESGAVGYVEASWAHPESVGLASSLEIAGDDGLIEYDTEDDEALVTADDGARTVENPMDADGYRRQLEAFVAALDGGEVPVTVADAVDALRLSLAARESAERGDPVAPAEVEA